MDEELLHIEMSNGTHVRLWLCDPDGEMACLLLSSDDPQAGEDELYLHEIDADLAAVIRKGLPI